MSVLATTLIAEKIPNLEAIELSPIVGWLLLACAVCAAVFFILQNERWRRWWLSAEDPRAIGLFRIVFGFFVIANVNDLWEHFTFLFTDEGIFPADVARQVHASAQFRGFGDGFTPDDPWGFYDFGAFIEFLKGPKYSLLYFWDTPAFFWSHLFLFELFAVFLVIGLWSRFSGVMTFLLMNSIFFRNHLFWEGTELVFRCFLVYLVLAKSGYAYSVDNWWRCRKLRRQKLLSERGGPGDGAGVAPNDEHPKGLAAIYRLIPAWPRRLMMLQLGTIYITTGLLKTGSVWWRGDPLYYAFNLDHFYRFPPQLLASLFGTNLFRVMSYMVKLGQTSFSLVIFGLIVRWAIANKLPPLSGARKWGVRAAFAGVLVGAAALVRVTWPVHYTPRMPAEAFTAAWLAGWGLLWWFWHRLGHRPFEVSSLFGLRKLSRTYVLDRMWFSTWFLGRRIFLVWHIAFHLHIFMLMNVGQFQTGMLSATIPFLTGLEVAKILRRVGSRLGKWGVPWIPADVTRGEPPIPSEDPTLPHLRHDSARLPDWALWAGLVAIVAGILVKVWASPVWDFRWVWVGAVVFLAGVGFQRWRSSRGKSLSWLRPDGEPQVPWAYGPFGRFVIGAFTLWHVLAVMTWLLPAKDSLKRFRAPARQVFATYLTRTTTDQGWGMFAPNPPRSNVFLKVLVTDKNGDTYDLRTDVYAEERKPIPWIWNDRIRKMNRRIIGGESGPSDWYRKWHARYHCRQWAFEHGGEAPEKVDLVKIWYRIPSPEQVRARGYYVAEELLERTGHEEVKYTERCDKAVMGQLPNWVRKRHDLPLLEPDTYRPWIKNKRRKWEKRKKREREKKAKQKSQSAVNTKLAPGSGR